MDFFSLRQSYLDDYHCQKEWGISFQKKTYKKKVIKKQLTAKIEYVSIEEFERKAAAQKTREQYERQKIRSTLHDAHVGAYEKESERVRPSFLSNSELEVLEIARKLHGESPTLSQRIAITLSIGKK